MRDSHASCVRRNSGEDCVSNIQGFAMAYLISIATQQTIGALPITKRVNVRSKLAGIGHACM